MPGPTGRVGRPRLVLPAGCRLGQVIKPYAQRHVVGVVHRGLGGPAAAIATALVATHGGTVLNTASSERLKATVRQHLVPLVRRGRALARTTTRLTAGRSLVGCAYHLCWFHDRLRLAAPPGGPGTWAERTPAMAAGLTDHRWTMDDRLHSQVPLPAWVGPKRRRRPRKTRSTLLTLPRAPAPRAVLGVAA